MLGSFGLTIREVRKINEPSLEGRVETFSLTASSREWLLWDTVHGSSDLSQRTVSPSQGLPDPVVASLTTVGDFSFTPVLQLVL